VVSTGVGVPWGKRYYSILIKVNVENLGVEKKKKKKKKRKSKRLKKKQTQNT